MQLKLRLKNLKPIKLEKMLKMLKTKSTLYLIQVKKIPLITVSTPLFQQLKQGKLRQHVKLKKLEKHRKPKRHVKRKSKLQPLHNKVMQLLFISQILVIVTT